MISPDVIDKDFIYYIWTTWYNLVGTYSAGQVDMVLIWSALFDNPLIFI